MPTTGNGIRRASDHSTTHVGQNQIEDNTIIGGSNQEPITNKISNGIYIYGAMKDVTIRNNSSLALVNPGYTLKVTASWSKT